MFKKILVILLFAIILQFSLIIGWPVITSSVSTLNASANMSALAGTSDAVIATPLLLWFVGPILALGGIMWVVKVERR